MSALKDLIRDKIQPTLALGKADPLYYDNNYGYYRGLYNASGRCNEMSPDNTHQCFRKKDHPPYWRHIEGDGDGRVLAIWGGDPNHLTVTSTRDTPTVLSNILVEGATEPVFVVGVRKDGTTETVNLATGEFAVLEIPTWTTLEPPNAEQTALIAKWFANHRQTVRSRAISEYMIRDRWCREGMDEQLRNLGLEEHHPQMGGDFTFRLRFLLDDATAGKSRIETELRQVFDTPEVKAAIMAALPRPDGINIDGSNIRIFADNFHRK